MNQSPPPWSASLIWSNPNTLHNLRSQRGQIPSKSGIYVFSKVPFINSPGGILYVGKATSLKTRLASYLGDPAETRIFSRDGSRTSTTLKHPGKVQILMEAMHCGGHNIWVSWTCHASPGRLEGALIEWLQPAFNSRMEEVLPDSTGNT